MRRKQTTKWYSCLNFHCDVKTKIQWAFLMLLNSYYLPKAIFNSCACSFENYSIKTGENRKKFASVTLNQTIIQMQTIISEWQKGYSNREGQGLVFLIQTLRNTRKTLRLLWWLIWIWKGKDEMGTWEFVVVPYIMVPSLNQTLILNNVCVSQESQDLLRQTTKMPEI